MKKEKEIIYSYSSKIGSIKGNKVTIEKDSVEENIILNDIAHVRLIFSKDVLLNIVFLIIGILFMVVLCFVKSESVISPIGVLLISGFFMGALFYKKRKYSIQIVKIQASQIIIPLKKSELDIANEFIDKIVKFKSSNPEFRKIL